MGRSLASLAGAVVIAAGGLTAGDPPKDYRDVPPAELGVQPVSEAMDPKTGFVGGGKNPTSSIKTLTEIAGRPIPGLEADMRPGAKVEVGSDKGFLGRDERLLDVLAADNAYVVDELGLTHQELARHLRVLAAIGARKDEEARTAGEPDTPVPFTYHGRTFTVRVSFTRGYQLSPFRDGTRANSDAKVTNAGTGKVLEYSLLVPDMVERYGFYEGTGTPYRVDPKDIVAVLDFLKPRKGR